MSAIAMYKVVPIYKQKKSKKGGLLDVLKGSDGTKHVRNTELKNIAKMQKIFNFIPPRLHVYKVKKYCKDR